jgi:aldehyde dehydrogenase (NAD+)
LDEFRDKYVAKVASLKVGDPADPGTIIGPLINQKQATRLDSVVDQAVAAGARALLRGPVEGTLFSPAVLTDVTRDMAAYREEMFGPAVVLIPFETDEEAVRLANDSSYGLSGAVHTADLDRGVRLARELDTGMVHVNDASIHDEPIVAFGGEKASGIGRLNGQWSLDEFTTMKWVSVNHGRRQFPY